METRQLNENEEKITVSIRAVNVNAEIVNGLSQWTPLVRSEGERLTLTLSSNALLPEVVRYLVAKGLMFTRSLPIGFRSKNVSSKSSAVTEGCDGRRIMAGVTFREAGRKKMLWMALAAGGAFLILFGTGLHFEAKDFALWRRAAFEMQSPLANAMRISPFSTLSVPSMAMVFYAGLYLAIASVVAIRRFSQREL